MRDQLKKIWNYRFPFRNKYTIAIGVIFMILAIILIVQFCLQNSLVHCEKRRTLMRPALLFLGDCISVTVLMR